MVETETIRIPKLMFNKVWIRRRPRAYVYTLKCEEMDRMCQKAELVLANMMHWLGAGIAEIDEVNLEEGYLKITLDGKKRKRKKKEGEE